MKHLKALIRYPDFRVSKPQTVDLPGHGITTFIYEGKCPATGYRLYSCDNNAGDPRGVLGWHAIEWFIAYEYGYEGETLKYSWIAMNNDQDLYQAALKQAKKIWKKV